jgi:hypothetical protein
MRSGPKFAVAWGLALAPIFLFVPAVMIAGMGPCSYAHPGVMIAAFAIFICSEIASVGLFVSDARHAGRVIPAIVGIGLALLLLVLSSAFGYLTAIDYL